MMGIVAQLGCYSAANSDKLECSLGDLASSVGGQIVFGLLAATVLLVSFYLASDGGFATPAVLTVLCGGLLISALPPAYQTMAQVVIFVGLAAGVMAGLDKYVDRTP